jgi:creatinine amidohydrolase
MQTLILQPVPFIPPSSPPNTRPTHTPLANPRNSAYHQLMLTPARIALIYVNPVEYHGPHLPLSTDFDISRGLWERLQPALAVRGTPTQVASLREIHRGCDPARGPGTENTTLDELKRQVLTAARSAAQERPDLVLFLTFHGAPKHAAAIEAGITYLRTQNVRAYNPFNHVLQRHRDYDPSWMESVAPLITEPYFRERWLETVPTDFHGGLFETSVLLALNPDKVSPDWKKAPDCPDRFTALPFKIATKTLRALGFESLAREMAIAGDATAWASNPTYLGYTGKPRLATAEIGEAFVEIILRDYVEGFEQVLSGRAQSPKPILQWTVRLT